MSPWVDAANGEDVSLKTSERGRMGPDQRQTLVPSAQAALALTLDGMRNAEVTVREMAKRTRATV